MKLNLNKLTIAPLEENQEVQGGATGTTCDPGCGYTVVWCYTKQCRTKVMSRCYCPIAPW